MYGAIIGDICGSSYEFNPCKTDQVDTIKLPASDSQFTDDTVLTCAVIDAVLHGLPYAEAFFTWGNRYPNQGYGGLFRQWLKKSNAPPYKSYGNGSAMRVSPVGWAFPSLEQTLSEAERSAVCTHNHPEGIKGAQSVAAALFMARNGESKATIKSYIETTFHYSLDRTVAEIRRGYSFNSSCMKSVPQAITVFLESSTYSETVQQAISLGGDSDTIACIAGSIAEAYYKTLPASLVAWADHIIPPDMSRLVRQFYAAYAVPTAFV
ncbi:hypothetical protein PilKf_00674 [Pillotina sp. SPG140]|jgi:ADP-ribosylglycohydrolase